MSIGNDSAFPLSDEELVNPVFGMTYRQWLIGQALQGVLASASYAKSGPDIAAHDAIQCADAVIAQLDSGS